MSDERTRGGKPYYGTGWSDEDKIRQIVREELARTVAPRDPLAGASPEFLEKFVEGFNMRKTQENEVTSLPPGTTFTAHYHYAPTTFIWDGEVLRNTRGHAEHIEDIDQSTIRVVEYPS